MPGNEQILSGLISIANGWKGLATFWHLYLAVLLTFLAVGVRPTHKTSALLLLPPVLSVGLLAGAHGNPFNATAFLLMATILLLVGARLPDNPARLASPLTLGAGIAMIGFGWVYPHFTAVSSELLYLIASPLGLVPCPTISVVIGATFLLAGFESRSWCLALAVFGAFYGSFGVFRLGVLLDWPLLIGAVVLAAYALRLPHGSFGGARPA